MTIATDFPLIIAGSLTGSPGWQPHSSHRGPSGADRIQVQAAKPFARDNIAIIPGPEQDSSHGPTLLSHDRCQPRCTPIPQTPYGRGGNARIPGVRQVLSPGSTLPRTYMESGLLRNTRSRIHCDTGCA